MELIDYESMIGVRSLSTVVDEEKCIDVEVIKSIVSKASDQLEKSLSQTKVSISLWMHIDNDPKHEQTDSIMHHDISKSIEILTINPSCDNKHKVFISNKLFTDLLRGLPWNAAYFGVIYERTPNIYNPLVDTLLSLLFTRSSREYRLTF